MRAGGEEEGVMLIGGGRGGVANVLLGGETVVYDAVGEVD